MPTLRSYIREAVRRGGPEVGYVVPVATSGLAATSATSAALADGSPSQKIENKHITRRDTATAADRKRIASTFNGATGAITISSPVYTDTVATSENLEITELEPYLFEWATQITLGRLKHFDAIEFPTYQGVRYWLHELTWLTSLADLAGYKVCYRGSPQLTRNRYLEKWHCVSPDTASTTALPDHWTLAGASGTCNRSTTGAVRGKYAAAVTRAGATTTLSITVPDYIVAQLRGETVGMFARFQAATASQARIQVYDGTDTTSGSYHTGGGEPEEFTISHTVNAAATEVTFRLSVETTNGTVYMDEAYGFFGGHSEALARDDFGETQVNAKFAAGEGTLGLILNNEGLGGQYIVYTKRPYPTFDEDRLMAGSADGDSVDAPLVAVATGILARAYEQKASSIDQDPRQPYFARLAQIWSDRFDREAQRNLYKEQAAGGQRAIKRAFTVRPRRFGRY